MSTDRDDSPKRVFISSTFIDLKAHRQVALSALHRAGLASDPMEDWPADPREPQRASLDRVSQCDIFLLLVGRRRGHVPAGQDDSITQQEYREALRLEKPILVFMLSDKAAWYADMDERTTDSRLGPWLQELKVKHIVETFDLQPSTVDVLPAIHRLLPHLSQTTKIEQEYKLSSPSNTQFKFSTIQQPQWIITRLLTICGSCGIECNRPVPRTIFDVYYDDRRQSLNSAGLSIRKRIEGDNCSITCKSSGSTAERALRRLEIELPCDELLADALESGRLPEPIKHVFWSKMQTSLANVSDPFGVSLKVHNHRTEIPLRTDVGKYTFCYDRYFYEADRDYSEYFSEIEIEINAEIGESDPKLERLVDTLRLLTDYTPEVSSKYRRGVEWLRTRGASNRVWVLVFEIIGLESRAPSDQKQALQALCHYIKTEFVAISYDVTTLIQSPYPSGFLLLFDELPSVVLSALRRAIGAMRGIDDVQRGRTLNVRAVLDQGNAVRYSGVTENLVIGCTALGAIGEIIRDVPANCIHVGESVSGHLHGGESGTLAL